MSIDHYDTPTQALYQESPDIPNEIIEIIVDDSETLRDVCLENYILAESLEMVECYKDSALPIQQEALQSILKVDAHALITAILPNDNIEQKDTTTAPLLTDVFLLVRTYDITGDTEIREALECVFDQSPPAASEPIANAFHRAIRHNTSIMQEYCKISRYIDENIGMIDQRRAAAVKQQLDAEKALHRRQAEARQRERRQRRITQGSPPMYAR